ncbi:AraC family transcriptional regulator [Hyphomicrobium sp.]|uniref:AraC family transcriptional regulator n=1 Tax=Hyphomicrobium sp. TaxID=82 RepID=UPI0025C1DFC5|nr:AraC family transcriptional regulator [Hyphomicrobium sp.]MCC7251065.1 helix-turn-helix transcriptional regulator [Hyphomicrobium sp.]
MPTKTIGIGENTTLKMSFWHSTVEDAPQASDSTFLSLSMRTNGGRRAWRDDKASGEITTLPFEGAHWRFEQPVSFVQFHLPVLFLGTICDALFDRELAHTDFRMLADIEDAPLESALRSIQNRAWSIEPTNLLLDSWAVILSEVLLRRLSRHGERRGRASFGKIPGRTMASVVDYIDANIDQDLRLTSLACVAAMSVYHFARSFEETAGISPHKYVLTRRIARARAMLRSSEIGLAHVALACGFSSQAHFTTTFRQMLGVTPGRYRQTQSP